jgi:hypothetical protein
MQARSLAVRFTAKEFARRLDAFAFGHMHAASSTGQHTLRFFSIPGTTAGSRASAGAMVRFLVREHAEKGTRQRPDSDEKNDDDQENDQKQLDEHAHSKKQSPFMGLSGSLAPSRYRHRENHASKNLQIIQGFKAFHPY